MKTFLTLTLILTISLNVLGQNSDENIQDKDVRYLSKKGITFYVLDLKNSNTLEPIEEKQTAYPLEFVLPNTLIVRGEYTEVQFLTISNENDKEVYSLDGKSSTKLKGSEDYINSEDNGKRFFIKTNELSRFLEDGNIEQQFKKWSPKLVTGATISTPFKFRPKVGDKNYIFSPELSLGPFIGANFRMDKKLPIFLNLILSAGINSININDNVQLDEDEKDGLALGFYTSVGAVVQINDFQVGALYGYDFVSGEMGKNWLYNEKPWFSFSIGFNFLSSINKAEAKAKKQTKEINDQILLKEFLTDKNVEELYISKDEKGNISYKKKYADAKKTLDIIPKETSEAKDIVIKNDSKDLKAAKVIQELESSSKGGKWVYFGELIDGKYSGEFGTNLSPEVGQEFVAKSAVFKRDNFPVKLADGNWVKGNIIGAVEPSEAIKIIETKATSDNRYLWVRIE